MGVTIMFKKLWIIALAVCLLCTGGCKEKTQDEESGTFCLKYYSLQELISAIQESKQKKLANEKMFTEEIFLSNLTEFAYPKVIPEGYELYEIQVWVRSIVYHYLPAEKITYIPNTDRTTFDELMTYIYSVCDDPTVSYFEGLCDQYKVEPTEDGVLYIEEGNRIVKAVGNNAFRVQAIRNVYQSYEALLPFCEEQMIQVE